MNKIILVDDHSLFREGIKLLIENKGEHPEDVKNIQLQSKLKIRKSCGHKERIGEMF